MLIDFVGENIHNSSFNSAQHLYQFLSDCSYEMGCLQIVLELKSTSITHRDSLWMLSTNLIDRCSANQNRAISYFTLQPNKKRFILDFPSVAFYPLERIHAYPSFELKNIFGRDRIEISNVIVKAQIRRRCSDSANR